MSIGPLGGLAGSAAGSPLAQSHGTETERTQQDSAAQQRQIRSEKKAESAAGIGETDGEDHEAEDRDADGRRIWEETPGAKKEETDESATPPTHQSKDPTGERGNLLDLTG